jgi:hypothetical protein
MSNNNGYFEKYKYYEPQPHHGNNINGIITGVENGPEIPWLTEVICPDGTTNFVLGEEVDTNSLNPGFPQSYFSLTLRLPAGAVLLDTKAWPIRPTLETLDESAILKEEVFLPVLSNFKPLTDEKIAIDPCLRLTTPDHKENDLEPLGPTGRGNGICATALYQTRADGSRDATIFYLPPTDPSRTGMSPVKYPLPDFIRNHTSFNGSLATKGLFVIPLLVGKNNIVSLVVIDDSIPYNLPDFAFKQDPPLSQDMPSLSIDPQSFMQNWMYQIRVEGKTIIAIDDDLLLPIEAWLNITCFNAKIVG